MPDIFIAHESKSNVKKPVEHKKKATPPRFRFRNSLSAYLYKPDGVDFETKHETEEVILFLRRHLITNAPWVLIAVLMILAPVLLSSFPVLDFLPPNFRLMSVFAWYLLVTAFILENFLIWFFNVGIVTNKRIVDIDFHSLLYKEVADTEINKIQDVNYTMGGAIRAVFNYGDVFVQTASEKPNIEFLAIPRPDEVVRVLQKLREKI